MSEPIKVLNINYNSDPYGGVPVFLMNIYQHIDHNKILIDFLTPDITPFNPYKKDIEQTGGEIYDFHINCSSIRGKLLFGKRLKTFLSKHSYNIVHINSALVPFDCIAAVVSKYTGAKVIIHSHNACIRAWWKKPIIYFMKVIMQKNADVLCACSKKAALYTFTSRTVNQDKVNIIKNGIDLQKFKFNKEDQNNVKKQLHLENRLVIGNVGRFVKQKNHEFIIDIFFEILKKDPTAALLLIGQGELEPVIREKVQKLHMEKSVVFLGTRDDVEDLYQGMDVFLFPSLYEGLPISLIEAQTNGLPCVISDTVTEEVNLTDLIHRESIEESPQKWANTVMSCILSSEARHSRELELRNSGYDVKESALRIARIYERIIR